ncbi:MAG: hypothetical protein ACXVDN_11365 [Ktedonobacteraceae bacterium]
MPHESATDARDSIKLARLLDDNPIPAVWVPLLPVCDLRAGHPPLATGGARYLFPWPNS